MVPEKLLLWGEKSAACIERLCKETKRRPTIFYRGMSGISLATATAMVYGMKAGNALNMLYCRKASEVSDFADCHGLKNYEYSGEAWNPVSGPDETLFIFLDDFLSTGKSFGKGVERVLEFTETHPSLLRFEIVVAKEEQFWNSSSWTHSGTMTHDHLVGYRNIREHRAMRM